MAVNLVGQTLANYRIVEPLGAGGMGVVYKAQDLALGRYVALKLLRATPEQDTEAIERFRREARTASALNHPNICTIYSFAEHQGQLLLAMELLDGDPLDKRIHGKPLDLRTTLEFATQIADALDAAHAQAVVHRDIKPANIFVSKRGQVKVLDFGLAKLAAGGGPESNVTQQFSSMAGTTVGTVSYMSPEQARGEELDQRSDLFSFGVVLYEMTTGRQSFSGSTTAVIFDGILNREPPPPRTLNASVPTELERIINKALEKDRALRYQTAADMRADLQRLKRDSGSRIVTAIHGVPGSASAIDVGSSPTDAVTVAVPAVTVGAPTPASATAPTVLHAAAGATPTAPRPGLSRTSIVAIAAGAVIVAVTAGLLAITYISRQAPLATEDSTQAGEPAAPQAAAAVPDTVALPAVEQAPPPPATPQPAPSPVPVTTVATARPAAKTAAAEEKPIEKAPAAETVAAERLDIAQAKIANNLLDPALADLRQIVNEFPVTQAAVEAAFLSASVLEKLGRDEDAMAAHVEFTERYGTDRRAPASKLRLAELVGRSRRPNRELAERDLLGDVVRDYAGTPQAFTALQGKIRIETQRRIREKDPVLGIDVPAALVSLRTLTEQFPNSPATLNALSRLAEMYEDANQHERAAGALTAWASRGDAPPDAWFRVGEFYERRLRDPARARAAFERVPPTAPRYRDAQRKLSRK